MGSNRSYDFITGFETSTAPTATTPSADTDIMNKGYADDTYAKNQYWGDGVADTTALKAIGSSDRFDKQVRLKEDTGDLWAFDSASSATEDGTSIIQPTSGTGRWLIASGGGSAGGGSASGLEVLQTQNQLATLGLNTSALDNSVRANGLEIPAHKYITGNFIENYTSGGSTAKIVWNPVVVFDSDKDYDSITNWSAIDAAGSLAATAGNTKVGSNHFSFNKAGTNVSASIRHTLAAQTLSVGANFRVYFWIDMPSVTDLTNVFLRIMGAATSDFSRWNLTTTASGGAITTGYNLFFVDIKNTAASTTGGTAWTTTQLARYVEVGVTTGSAGQTYTGIKFAGLWFSHGQIDEWAPKCLEFTVADTSNKHDFKIDTASTTQDGTVTLAASVAQNYTAGVAAAARGIWYRSPMSWSQAGLIGFDTTLTSGTIALEQEMRISKVLRESLSGNYGVYCDLVTPQIYKVTVVGGSTIGVADSENHSANLLNGDSIHIFTTSYCAGEATFSLLATRAMTAGSSHSSGTTTLTVSPTGIAVGDYVVKQHLTASYSVTSKTANETYSTASYATTPNGAQLLGANSYPNPANVYAHWLLGASTDAMGLRDLTGNTRTLNKVGSPNLQQEFKAGKFAVSSLSTSNYLRTAVSTVQNYDGSGEVLQISLWLYFDGALGSNRAIVAGRSYTGAVYNGWQLYNASSSSTLSLQFFNAGGSASASVSTASMTSATWNHVILQIQSSTNQKIYLNGTLSSTSAGAINAAASGQALMFGATSDSNTMDSSITQGATGLRIADCIVWRDGALLSQTDVNYLYNGGIPRFYGYNPSILRNEYTANAVSGQRVSAKFKLNRTTSAVSPYILQAGIIKTG